MRWDVFIGFSKIFSLGLEHFLSPMWKLFQSKNARFDAFIYVKSFVKVVYLCAKTKGGGFLGEKHYINVQFYPMSNSIFLWVYARVH